MKKNSVAPKIGGAVYILPNLLTTGNLFFGYFSIIKSMEGDFTAAATAILLASVFDILDGRVARMTNGSSEFGVQYDSLCDLMSFGIAPAIMVYHYSLSGLGRIAWALCFIYVLCGALRLARFNVQASIGQNVDGFIGLPIPMPAGLLSCFVAFLEGLKGEEKEGLLWFVDFAKRWDFFSTGVQIFFCLLLPMLAFMMVSNVFYFSHKSLNIKGIDFLCNVAGVITRGKIDKITDEDYNKTMKVNVEAPFRLCRASIPLMKKGSAIVNVSSCWGLRAGPDHPLYIMSKAAIASLSQSLGLDHANQGIRINAVCPNEVNTPMIKSGFKMRGLDSKKAIEELNSTVPLGRIAEPEDIVDVILFLLSNESRYMCGSIVEVNGAKPVI